ncbi:unnamed protein product [Pleuronectes platessa]|uniref:Uncharacterized protein n=1 Tax=Pleuronectes platessa TaxID=8262 RepID=A0A9N7VGK1_PLEPL|nr:unnamed protein product [Pleuronectes platessa]
MAYDQLLKEEDLSGRAQELARRPSSETFFSTIHNCDTAVNPCRTKHHSVAEGRSCIPSKKTNEESARSCTHPEVQQQEIHWTSGKIRATRMQHREGHKLSVKSGPSRGSPQLRRPLGEPSVRAGGHPAVRLGWRLAAD